MIGPYEEMVYAQPGILPLKCDTQISLGFGDTNGSPNIGLTIRPRDSQQKIEKLLNRRLEIDMISRPY